MDAGYLPKLTVQPERVLSPRQTAAFEQWMTSPAAMPGYGLGGATGGGIDYERLGAVLAKYAAKSTHIAVDATGFNADVIARKVAEQQRVEEFLSA
jgi:hypothetical protein